MTKAFSGRTKKLLGIFFGLWLLFAYLTLQSLEPIPRKLIPEYSGTKKFKILDRFGNAISDPHGTGLNVQDYVELGSIDDYLQEAFVVAEDKRFFEHHGIDWKSRFSAVFQNIKALRVVRGASTITEQVVRMLHPRPRTLWSRWLEGIEAVELEEHFSKEEILEFYLNEVPYGSERRGVEQASRLYFDRDLSSLNNSEKLALTTLVRAPSEFDPRISIAKLQGAVERLVGNMKKQGFGNQDEKTVLFNVETVRPITTFINDTYHFSEFVKKVSEKLPLSAIPNGNLITTLDRPLQDLIFKILNGRLRDLKSRNVKNGAVLVVDHSKNEILAWVNSSVATDETPDSFIDAVLSPRQPGSALKPFLYSIALERGWTPATLIEDSPISDAVGTGLHAYKNFSHLYYGQVRLRDALANSLNIPAVRAVGFVGVPDFFSFLKKLGFESLDNTPEHYGEGLALGNGEVSLYELVRAYTVLARGGVSQPLSVILGEKAYKDTSERLISEETSSLIANILSDPVARRLEFGSSGILNFPKQTAVKTGTSTDFKDVWAVGYSGPYTVGVWMGNLDRTSTRDLTGASGPSLVLRSIFHELSKQEFNSGLRPNSNLVLRRICGISGKLAGEHCPIVDEWFNPNNFPQEVCNEDHKSVETGENKNRAKPTIMVPTPGLQIAMDPRIPESYQALGLRLRDSSGFNEIRWYVDGEFYKEGNRNPVLWPLQKGKHSVWAETLVRNSSNFEQTDAVNFIVK